MLFMMDWGPPLTPALPLLFSSSEGEEGGAHTKQRQGGQQGQQHGRQGQQQGRSRGGGGGVGRKGGGGRGKEGGGAGRTSGGGKGKEGRQPAAASRPGALGEAGCGGVRCWHAALQKGLASAVTLQAHLCSLCSCAPCSQVAPASAPSISRKPLSCTQTCAHAQGRGRASAARWPR